MRGMYLLLYTLDLEDRPDSTRWELCYSKYDAEKFVEGIVERYRNSSTMLASYTILEVCECRDA